MAGHRDHPARRRTASCGRRAPVGPHPIASATGLLRKPEFAVSLPCAVPYRPHPVRGPLNALFFTELDGYVDRLLRPHKQRLFRDLPASVLELGSGVGANLRYLPAGSRLVAVEPNPAMHGPLRARAARAGIELDLHPTVAERIDLPDESVDAVISSLVLCTVPDPAGAVSEVLRVLRPGGRYAFLEHVAAVGLVLRGLLLRPGPAFGHRGRRIRPGRDHRSPDAGPLPARGSADRRCGHEGRPFTRSSVSAGRTAN
jgi:SAM-dependent methyltransferase